MKSILELFLRALDVRYTKSFVERLNGFHRDRNNMYGLKRMLSVYGVRTMGVYVEDREVDKLNFPCILHTSDGFVIGLDDDGAEISYLLQGKRRRMRNDEFGRYWTGNALVVCDESRDAMEPNYDRHRKREMLDLVKAWSLPVSLILLVLYGASCRWQESELFAVLGTLMCMGGLSMCLVLAQRQVSADGWVGDRACSAWTRADCGGVLDSPRSKVLGISWSEVGFGYFGALALLLSLFPGDGEVVWVINLLGMCYGVWSVFYQWLVVKGWCVWCLMVQAMVWAMGILGGFILDIRSAHLAFGDVPLACLLIAAMALLAHFCMGSYALRRKYGHALRQYRDLKTDRGVFDLLLGRQGRYEVSRENSSILFGNVSASYVITIFLSPYCNPCAKLHVRVSELLGMYGDDICVQYIFASFNGRMEKASRLLISLYEEHGKAASLEEITKWYDTGRRCMDIPGESDKLHTPFVNEEMRRHQRWSGGARLSGTPTVLVNGSLLPSPYRVEDVVMASQSEPR